MISTLRRRVLLTILGLVGPAVILLASLLYWTVQRSVVADFDRDLVELANTMVALVEYDDDGYEFALGPQALPPGQGMGAKTYVQLRAPGGELITQTPGWQDTGLADLSENAIGPAAQELPDASFATGALTRPRGLVRSFVPPTETDAADDWPDSGPVQLSVVRDGRALRASLTRLAAWFLALGLITLGAACFAAIWAARRGLAPLEDMAQALQRVGPDAMDQRINDEGVAQELVPVVHKTNALLDRLELAFERERRFTNDVAHELRTPLTVLRAELELGLRRERSAAQYVETLERSLQSAEDLSSLVDKLLMLARVEGRHEHAKLQSIAVAGWVQATWAPLATQAVARGLDFRCKIDSQARWSSDPELLSVVLSNLLSNALAYAEPGGWIRVERDLDAGIELAVVDSGPPLSPGHAERVFERFWRADVARQDAGEHCGIGLSLTRVVCNALDLRIAVEPRAAGAKAFVIRRQDSA